MTSTAQAGAQPGAAYEKYAYPGFTYRVTHPAHTEVLARLFGLQPPAASAARVLELGCGDGANLLSMAQSLPGATFLGIDAAPGAIARGEALRQSAGLTNARLITADLERLPADMGPFDYIVAHGVYSWIPPRARGALLECCRERLAPQGVAYVSYNAYPGSYLRDMARDMLLYHVGDEQDPEARLASAHEFMATVVAIEEPSPFARVLRDHMGRMLESSDALLFHDELAEVSTPFYFHEFMEHAMAHGLQFLSEGELSESHMRGVPASAAQLIQRLPDDVLVREQYLDFFKNRMFRQTLLCHAEASVRRAIDDDVLEPLALHSPARPGETGDDGEQFVTPNGDTMTTSEPLIRAAMHALADAWPAALPFPELLARARDAVDPAPPAQAAADHLRAVMLEAYVARVVLLTSVPPPLVATPSERPRAAALARAQAAEGRQDVCTLVHANVKLEALDVPLLALLDGTRDRAALETATGIDGEQLVEALRRLAWLALLTD